MKIKEFRSVAEAAPALLDALAKGGNVARDSLKKMSQDGLLTTKFVADALQKSMLDLIVATEGIPKTVGQAFQNLSTGFQFFIGELNKTYGITEGLSGIISELASGMVGLGKSLQDGKFQEVTNNLLIMTGVIGGAATAFYIMDAANKSANVSLLEYVKNLRIATGAQALFNIVAAANPYVILAATIIGVATALYSMRNATVEVGGTTVSIGSLIVSTFESLKERVGSAFIFITESYKKITKGLQDAFVGIFNFLKDTIAGKILGALVDAFTNTLKALGQIGIRFAKALGLDKLTEQFNAFVSDLGQDIVIGAVVRDSKGAKPEAVNPFLGGGGTATVVETEATKKLREERERLAEQNAEFRKNYLAETALLQSVNDLIAQGLPLKEAELEAQKLVDTQKAISAGLTQLQIDKQYALRDAIKATADAEKAREDQKKYQDSVDKDFAKNQEAFLKPEELKIGDLFGDASKGAGALINAFQDINKQQEAYNELLADAVVNNRDVTDIEKQRAKNELRNIGNILGATKGFFKEKSAGYKVLSAAEKAYKAFELASTIKNFAIEKGLTLETIGIKLSGYAQTAIAAVSSAGTSIAALLGIGATAGAVAPVTAAAGTPGPAAFVAFAAMAALVAAAGFGGSKTKGSFAPTNEGTGTVFGDKSAKSESIKRSIDLLAENSKIELPITSAMLRSLQNIESNIGGLTNLVIRKGAGEDLAKTVSTGFKESGLGKGLRTAVGIVTLGASELLGIGKLIGGLFGTKISIKGQGLLGEAQNLSSITSEGFNLREYVDINKKKKSFGFTTSNKNSTRTSAASDELERQFTLIFTGFYDAIKLAAVPLGQNLNDVTSRLDNFVVKIGKINLKGLKGEEIQEKLEAVFGAAADSIAQAAIPGLEDFQKVGEGYFETVVRVSSGIEQAAQALDLFGVTAVNFKDIILKQGDVGAEIVRQSLVLANGVSGVSEILSIASVDSVDAIVELATQLYSLRDNVIAIGNGFADVTISLIKGAGGVDRLQDGLDTFFNDFLDSQEQTAELTRRTTREFAKLGLALPASKEAFKTLVQGIDTTTSSGQELLGSVLALSPAFLEMSSAAEDAGSSLTDAARSLYETIRDARVESLVPTQQLDVLLSEYQSAVNLATQSTGQNLADNAGVVNNLIKPLLDSIKSVFASGPEAQRLIDSVLGQAKNVADKAANEAFTYQDESLRLLQAQVNELEAIRSALSIGVFTPVNLGTASNVVPITTGNTGSLNVSVQSTTDNTAIITALTESNAHAAALVRLQQAANQQIIAKLTEMEERLDGLESSASLAASA